MDPSDDNYSLSILDDYWNNNNSNGILPSPPYNIPILKQSSSSYQDGASDRPLCRMMRPRNPVDSGKLCCPGTHHYYPSRRCRLERYFLRL